MPRKRGEVGRQRREQIIEAAVGIIAEEGLQHLSLSAIETRAGMSRGQLTYYFRTKEDILLGVFDRMIATMHDRSRTGEGPPGCSLGGLEGGEKLRAFLAFFLLHPPDVPEFHALQYTFLSQVGHREDFRQRLAGLYEHWRSEMASDFSQASPTGVASPRTLASLVQAILHGLAIQRVADPNSYDRREMLDLCMHLLEGHLGKNGPPPSNHPPESLPPSPRKRKR